jgi:hypothetical protein
MKPLSRLTAVVLPFMALTAGVRADDENTTLLSQATFGLGTEQVSSSPKLDFSKTTPNLASKINDPAVVVIESATKEDEKLANVINETMLAKLNRFVINELFGGTQSEKYFPEETGKEKKEAVKAPASFPKFETYSKSGLEYDKTPNQAPAIDGAQNGLTYGR